MENASSAACPRVGERLRGENDYHLAARFAGLHHSMSLADLLEAEDPGWLDIEAAGRGIRRDLLQRHVGERKARSAENEAAEKS